MTPAGGPQAGLCRRTVPDIHWKFDCTPVGRFLEKRGAGLHHVCYRVPDIQAALDRLRATGARLIDERPRLGAGGHLVAFVHPSATGGVLVELAQASDASHPSQGETS